MKKRAVQLLGCLLAVTFLCALVPANAFAETAITVPVTSASLINDVESDVLMYDPSNNDTADVYYFNYKTSMDMSSVWANWGFLRLMYLFSGNTLAQWQAKILDAQFVLSAKIDLTRVSVDQTVITDTDAVLSAFKAANSGVADTFLNCCSCSSATWTPSTGVWTATIEMQNLSVGALEADPTAQPAAVNLVTPDGALFVKQSNFQAEQSFSATQLTFTGSVSMRYMYISALPITFNQTAPDITINMKKLPIDVTFDPDGGTLPQGDNGLRNGNAGDSLLEPEEPVRDGYKFGGWFTERNGGGTQAPDVFPSTSTVYYAMWTKVEVPPLTADASGAWSLFAGLAALAALGMGIAVRKKRQ